MTYDVDLFVIGGGSGGVRAARIAASYGASVMIAEEFRMGGTCVIRGCVPKKLYVYASRFVDDFADAAGFGWTLPEKPVFHWPTLVAAKEKEISRLSQIYANNLAKAGVKIFETRAEIIDANTIELKNDGRRIRAKKILVATGGAPVLEPAIPGVEHTISSNEIFDLPEFPKRLLVIGGGYIAVEFASVFARLGAQVTIAFRGENILRGFDDDMREGLRVELTHAGIAILPGTLPTALDKRADGLAVSFSDDETRVFDQVLVATGRRPHTQGLGLENAGVAMDHVGAIKVDAYSRTNVESIFAVGDVTNRVNLTPVAIREGHAFADTQFGGKEIAVVHTDIPTAVFTTPEIGTVGMSEAEARRIFDVVDIYQASFRPMKATLSGHPEKTIMKIVVDGKTDQVLGV
ncbi:MAG: glutathione reductase, partial [Hyphomicrobiales bacterium]|nr:glutathione reductase [Hyphomicrobiales bacterium]